MIIKIARVVELVDTRDLKSLEGDFVPVQVRPRVPNKEIYGRYGFGGPCFPKDVKALIQYSKEIGNELTLLKKANSINNNIRAKYNDETVREKEQNIKFNSKKEE